MDLILEILKYVGFGLFGFFISWLLQRLSYKDEYYKKVIDKRLEAYNKLESVVNSLRTEIFLEGKAIYHKVFLTWEDYTEFYNNIVDVGKYSFWLDNQTEHIFIGLNLYLIDNIPPADLKEGICSDYGKKHHDDINRFYEELEELLFIDLRNLYKLDSFFRQKVRNTERLVLQREEPE